MSDEIKITKGKFKPDWESLKNYECPEWFKRAKFGVWAHWGPQCVPEFGGWYARDMYLEGNKVYKFHRKHYGHPSEFGYKDIIKLFTARNFDADKLMKIYKDMGAKFFVTMGVHHDNYDMWDSKYHSWNSVNYGPHRDIVKEWKIAADKYNLRFGVSEHLERSYSWFATNKGCDKRGKYKGVPYDGNDKEYSELYINNSLADTNCAYPKNPSKDFINNWYLRIKDLIENYSPDFLYTDGGIPFNEAGRSMLANFYNHNINVNGKLEAVYAFKDMKHLLPELYHGDYIEGVGVLDLERTISDRVLPYTWQTDTCIGNWFYSKNCKYKSAEKVINEMIDVVSKNGVYLLSLPLRLDGTHDDREKEIIANIGEWMKINGEAIYDAKAINFPITSKVKFTRVNDYLYAFIEKPNRYSKTKINNPIKNSIKKIVLLGKGELNFKEKGNLIEISLPPIETTVNIAVLRMTVK